MKTAAAQTDANFFSSQANNVMGMVDQVTPYGTLDYQQNGNQRIYDPTSGKYRSVPTYRATQKYTPQGQAILSAQMGAERNLAELAQTQSGRLQGLLDRPFQLGDEAREGKLTELYNSRLMPQLDRRREGEMQSLADRGISIGSAAYDRAMEGVNNAENDAYIQTMLQARGLVNQELQTERQAPINEILGIASGTQLQNPQWVNSPTNPIGTPDIAGMTYSSHQADVAAWQQKQQMMGGMLSGLGGLFSLSDARLKADVEPTGARVGPLAVYSFRYVFEDEDAPRSEGLMAQEVAEVLPDAVREIGGYLHVDYGAVASAFGGGV